MKTFVSPFGRVIASRRILKVRQGGLSAVVDGAAVHHEVRGARRSMIKPSGVGGGILLRRPLVIRALMSPTSRRFKTWPIRWASLTASSPSTEPLLRKCGRSQRIRAHDDGDRCSFQSP